jgi:hypothetical protein
MGLTGGTVTYLLEKADDFTGNLPGMRRAGYRPAKLFICLMLFGATGAMGSS